MDYKGGQGNGSQGNVKTTDIYKIKGQVTIQDKFTNEIKGTITQADVTERLAKEDTPTETTNGSESNENTGILSSITNYIAKI